MERELDAWVTHGDAGLTLLFEKQDDELLRWISGYGFHLGSNRYFFDDAELLTLVWEKLKKTETDKPFKSDNQFKKMLNRIVRGIVADEHRKSTAKKRGGDFNALPLHDMGEI